MKSLINWELEENIFFVNVFFSKLHSLNYQIILFSIFFHPMRLNYDGGFLFSQDNNHIIKPSSSEQVNIIFYSLFRAKIPSPYNRLFRFILLLQTFCHAFVPIAEEFWGKKEFSKKFVHLLVFGFSLRSGNSESNLLTYQHYVIDTIFYFDAILTFILIFYFRRHHRLPKICYFYVAYLTPFLNLVGLSYMASITGTVLGTYVFVNDKKLALTIFQIITICWVFYRVSKYIRQLFYCSLLLNPIFLSWSPHVYIYWYFSNALGNLWSNALLAYEHNEFLACLPIAFASIPLLFVNLRKSYWFHSKDFIFSTSLSIFSIVGPILICLAMKFFKDSQDELILHLGSIFLLILICVFLFNHFVLKKNRRTQADKDEIPFKSKHEVYKMLISGLASANPSLLNEIDFISINERYPKDFDFVFFFTLMRLSFPLSQIDTEMLVPELKSVNHIEQPYAEQVIEKVRGPILPSEIEQYNINVQDLKYAFSETISSFISILECIEEDLIQSLPKYSYIASQNFINVANYVFNFLELYPGSPDSKLFSNIYNTLFSGTRFETEMTQLNNYKYNGIPFYISSFPLLTKEIVLNPNMIQQFKPSYTQIISPSLESSLAKFNTYAQSTNLPLNSGPFQSVTKNILIWLFFIAFSIAIGFEIYYFRSFKNDLLIESDAYGCFGVACDLVFLSSMQFPIYLKDNVTFYNKLLSPWIYNDSKNELLHRFELLCLNWSNLLIGRFNKLKNRDLFITKYLQQPMNGVFKNESSNVYYAIDEIEIATIESLISDNQLISEPEKIEDTMKLLKTVQQRIHQAIDGISNNILTNVIQNSEFGQIPHQVLFGCIFTLFFFLTIMISIVLYSSSYFDLNNFYQSLEETPKPVIFQHRKHLKSILDMIKPQTQTFQYAKNNHKTLKMEKKKSTSYIIILIHFIIIHIILYFLFIVLLSSKQNHLRSGSLLLMTFSDVITNVSHIFHKIGQDIYKPFYPNEFCTANEGNAKDERLLEMKENILNVEYSIRTIQTQRPFNISSNVFCNIYTSFKIFAQNLSTIVKTINDQDVEDSVYADTSSRYNKTKIESLFSRENISLNQTLYSFIIHWLVDVASSLDFLESDTESVNVRYAPLEKQMMIFSSCVLPIFDILPLDIHVLIINKIKLLEKVQQIFFVIQCVLTLTFPIFLLLLANEIEKPLLSIIQVLDLLPNDVISFQISKALKGKWTKTNQLPPNTATVILDSYDHPVLIINETLDILYANHAISAIIPGTNIVGKKLYDALKKELLDDNSGMPFLFLVNQYMCGDRHFSQTFNVFCVPDSTVYQCVFLPLEGHNSLYHSSKTRPKAVLIFRDITNEILIENEFAPINEANKKLLKQIAPEPIVTLFTKERKRLVSFKTNFTVFAAITTDFPIPTKMASEHGQNDNPYEEQFIQIENLWALCKVLEAKIQGTNCLKEMFNGVLVSSGLFRPSVEPTQNVQDMMNFALQALQFTRSSTINVKINMIMIPELKAGSLWCNSTPFDIWNQEVIDLFYHNQTIPNNTVKIDKNVYKALENTALQFEILDKDHYLFRPLFS